MAMKPPRVVVMHRRFCEQNHCPNLSTLDYADPCIGCPAGHFGPWIISNCEGRVSSAEVAPVTLIKKAANLARAAGRAGKAAVTGNRVTVSDEEKERRLAICRGCEFYTGKTCKKCGCVMRFKARLATESCPVGKW